MSRSIEARTAAAVPTTVTLDVQTHQGLGRLLSNILECTGETFTESDAVRMGLRRLLKEARDAEFRGKKTSRRVLAGEMAEFVVTRLGD
jgi:hypothetical protein